jgi:glycosyltransferase involved in cell wall biosynthesis
MKVAMISRSSLFTSKGGDTIQIQQTARHLKELNVSVEIRLANEKINYQEYDLLHFFNLTRPADILRHSEKSKIPFVVTPLLIDYSEFDQQYRKGISGKIFQYLSAGQIEYFKNVARFFKGQETAISLSYLKNGHRKSIKTIIKKAAMLLPNSQMEYDNLVQSFFLMPSFSVIPNGIDERLFARAVNEQKDPNLILCVARIEGLKNQINLISALNDSKFQLYLIGSAAINQKNYYLQCKKIASANIHFIDHLPQAELIRYYQKARVHVLPSWFETCGLSTLEAAAMGCNIVITNRGYASEYYDGHAFYCDPSSPSSILEAIENASKEDDEKIFRKKVLADYTWRNAAQKTYEAYQKIFKNETENSNNRLPRHS